MQLLSSSVRTNERSCTILRLAGSILNRKEVLKLKSALEENTRMTELDLSHQALKSFDADFPLLAEPLVSHPNLACIELTRCGAGIKGIKCVEDLVKSNMNIVDVRGYSKDGASSASPLSLSDSESPSKKKQESRGRSYTMTIPGASAHSTPRRMGPAIKKASNHISGCLVENSAFQLYLGKHSLMQVKGNEGEVQPGHTIAYTVGLTCREFKAPPMSLFTCKNAPNLIKLDLSFNCISVLPRDVSIFTSLKCLVLQNNYLTEIPSTIGELRKLAVLNVACNRIQALPPSLRHLSESLTNFDISANLVTEIPLYLRRFKALNYFGLKGNPIRGLKKESLEKHGNAVGWLHGLDGDESVQVLRGRLLVLGQDVGVKHLLSCLVPSYAAPRPGLSGSGKGRASLLPTISNLSSTQAIQSTHSQSPSSHSPREGSGSGSGGRGSGNRSGGGTPDNAGWGGARR